MMLFPFGAPLVRRAVTTAAVLGIMTVVPAAVPQAAAQEPPAQPAAQPAAPQAPPPVTFSSPAGILIHQIKGDRTADFEWLVGKMKEALLKSEDAVVKQQAPGFKVFKNVDPLPQTGNILYVILVSPAVAQADYNMVTLLNIVYKAFPEEQQEIYKRVQGAFGGGVTRWNLEPIADFAK
jgi:hypothetical protein